MRTIRYVVAVFTSLLALAPTAARAEENFALWAKRMPISFGGYTPPGGGAPLTNFPALVVFSNSTAGAGFDYADFASPPYGDLRFAAADKTTPLDFEVESWDAEGLSYVWVKVPDLTADTVIYALWGMEGAEAPPCTTNGAVWAEGYNAVWHLCDGVDNAHVSDSTANRYHGTKKAADSPAQTDAVVGKGQLFASSYIDVTGLADAGKTHTLSMWINGGAGSAAANIFPFDIELGRLVVGWGSGTAGKIGLYDGAWRDFGNTPSLNAWHHIAFVCGASTVSLYVDGAPYGSALSYASKAIGGKVSLGSRYSRDQSYFPGMIDEARVASVVRSADWIWACWMSQASNGVFNAVGAPEFQDLPVIANAGGATNVTAASAWLNGALVATGTSATAVSVYWGTSDGGTNASDWGTGAHWPAPQAPGAFTVQATGLDADAAYFYRFAASNDAGVVWAEPSSVFITGEVWIEQTADALEFGPTPGTFTVHRASGAVGCDLVVAYSVGGTATPGADYAPLGGAVTIPAGTASAPLVVAPVFDRALEEDETVAVTLLPGPYVTGEPANAEVAITDYRLEVTWDGSGNSTWTQPDATSWSGATYETNGFATFGGAGQGTVTLSGTITPGGVTVSAGAYTFAGTAIAGDGGLTVSGGALTLNNANTYSGNTLVSAGATLALNDNNRLPYGAGKGDVTVDGTLSLKSSKSQTLNGLNGAGQVVAAGASWESETLTVGSGDASSTFSGAVTNTGSYLYLKKTGSGTVVLSGNNVYRGSTTVNGGTLALDGSNTLSSVTVNTGGTLRLGHPGALRGAPLVAVAGNATLDTAEMAAPYPFAQTQTLRIGGSGVTTTLATAPGNGLELLTTSKLHVNAYDGATPALTVTGGGSLTVSSNNAVTVTVAGDVPLPIGDYTLVSGGVAGETPTTYVTVNGAGRAAATTAALVIEGGDLILRIADYAPEHEPTSLATAAVGPWDAPATWQGGLVPGPGDRVTLNHAVTLACGTHPLASFSNNATLTVNGWNAPLVAGEVALNATVTHLAQSATAPDPVSGDWVPDNRVWIVCANLTVTAAGKIDTSGKGYACTVANSGGPGSSTDFYSGGSHGGKGEKGSGPTYGSAEAPVDPGSGGGLGSLSKGGGVVRIEASGAVTVDGEILARGSTTTLIAGEGSGGSVFITCRTLAGGGTVSANGGTSANVYSGGGGGGRIAVIYDPAAQEALPPPAITLDANGGRGGDLGTLYFPDNAFLTTPMRHCGQWLAPGLTGWTCDSLAFSNAHLRIPVPGFALGIAGGWTMTGAGDSRTYGLQVTNAQIACGGDVVVAGCTMRLTTDGEAAPSLTAGGDLSLQKAGTMASALYLHAAQTNGGPRNCGLPVTVGGTFTIATNCTVYPYSHGTDGGSVHFTVGSLCLEAGGLIDANAKGYNGGKGPGASLSQAGASYGGRGAGSTWDIPKPPYGCEEWPQDPGSGGRADMAGIRGGGLVTIEAAARMRIDGTIRTTGADGGAWTAAASGGGVALSCKWLSGSGQITANGGASVHEWCRGAGGRIALWYLYDNTTGLSNRVAAAKGGVPAEDGTVFWGKLNAPGTVLLLR